MPLAKRIPCVTHRPFAASASYKGLAIDTGATPRLFAANFHAGTIDVAGRTVKVGVQGARIAGMNQMIPLGRGGFPEEAAGAIYLFCSPDSDFVSGQTLVVTGGA